MQKKIGPGLQSHAGVKGTKPNGNRDGCPRNDNTRRKWTCLTKGVRHKGVTLVLGLSVSREIQWPPNRQRTLTNANEADTWVKFAARCFMFWSFVDYRENS